MYVQYDCHRRSTFRDLLRKRSYQCGHRVNLAARVLITPGRHMAWSKMAQSVRLWLESQNGVFESRPGWIYVIEAVHIQCFKLPTAWCVQCCLCDCTSRRRLESFDKSRNKSRLRVCFILSRYCHYCAVSDVKQYSLTHPARHAIHPATCNYIKQIDLFLMCTYGSHRFAVETFIMYYNKTNGEYWFFNAPPPQQSKCHKCHSRELHWWHFDC